MSLQLVIDVNLSPQWVPVLDAADLPARNHVRHDWGIIRLEEPQ